MHSRCWSSIVWGWSLVRGFRSLTGSFLAAVLFLEYCFGIENSLSSVENSVSSAKNSASSLWHTSNRLRGTQWFLTLELSGCQKPHWVIAIYIYSYRCLKPYSPKPYSARFRFSGVLEESCRKASGKFGEIFPESQNAFNSRISSTGKGKPSANLGSTLRWTLSQPSVRGVFWNRQFQPSRVFTIQKNHNWLHTCPGGGWYIHEGPPRKKVGLLKSHIWSGVPINPWHETNT